MGQIIQSHALNFFHLSSPDFLLGFDSDPSKRNIFGLIEKEPELAMRGIRLRKFGQEIIEKVAGKKIHSSEWIQPGGAKWPLTQERADYLRGFLPEALDAAQKTLSMWKQMLDGLQEEVEHFGNFPTYYMGLVTPDGGLDHYDGKIRIMDPQGKVAAECV